MVANNSFSTTKSKNNTNGSIKLDEILNATIIPYDKNSKDKDELKKFINKFTDEDKKANKTLKETEEFPLQKAIQVVRYRLTKGKLVLTADPDRNYLIAEQKNYLVNTFNSMELLLREIGNKLKEEKTSPAANDTDSQVNNNNNLNQFISMMKEMKDEIKNTQKTVADLKKSTNTNELTPSTFASALKKQVVKNKVNSNPAHSVIFEDKSENKQKRNIRQELRIKKVFPTAGVKLVNSRYVG